ncbi:MAG: metallophosphoesterase [Phycisphaerales bacterium]
MAFLNLPSWFPFLRPRGADAVLADDGVPWRFESQESVFAVGDVHGDLPSLTTVLRGLQLVEADNLDWTGGRSTLVLVGDLVHRGDHSRQVMDLVLKLEAQAAQAGGRVEALLGNHEFNAAGGYHEDCSDLDRASFVELRDGPLVGLDAGYRGPSSPYAAWLRRRNTMVIVGETVFIHAHLGEWALRHDPAGVNATVRRQVEIAQRFALGPVPLLSNRYFWTVGAEGPLLNRDFAPWKRSPSPSPAQLRAVLDHLGARRVVVGHTTMPGQHPCMTLSHPNYGTAVAMIDTGMGTPLGRPAALEIRGSDVIAHHFPPAAAGDATPASCTP